jgi:hypothetical protein
MTILREILDFTNAAKDYDGIEALERIKKGAGRRSLYQMANESILVYPVFVPKSLPIESAMMAAKAIEREGTTIIRLVLAANQVQGSANLKDILSQYHNNLKLSSTPSVNDILDISDALDDFSEDAGIDTNIPIGDIQKQLNEDMGNINVFYTHDNCNEQSIENIRFTLDGKLYGTSLTEAPGDSNLAVNNNRAANDLIKGLNDYSKWSSDNKLLDNDVKKSNELIPSTFQVNLMYKGKDGVVIPLSFIIGVKAKLYPLDSDDIITHLVAKNKDMNNFTKLIKATTREISFIKDLLFAVDKAKEDALSNSRKGPASRAWRVLENLATSNKLRRIMGIKNTAMAITTLVISQEMADYIMANFKLNLMNENVITPIMRAYNLMSFVIMDDSTQTASFLFDETSPLYETISYKGLEKEGQNKEKQLLNIIGKMAK